MITRYALFKGHVAPSQFDQFKQVVMEDLLPTWLAYPGVSEVRVSFGYGKDDAAPECPLILAMDFPDQYALGKALESQERLASRAETQRVLPGLFDGQIFHYLTETETRRGN